MPIEFSCPQCSRVLRVSDEHAGKTARCPDCQTIMNIPAKDVDAQTMDYVFGGVESPVPDSGVEAPLSDQDPNRFPSAAAPQKPHGQRPFRPRRASFDEIFSYSWNAFKDNVWLLVGVTFVVFGFGVFVGIVQAIIEGPAQPQADPGKLITSLIIGLIGNIFSMFLAIGQVRINYDIARTGHASFSTLFSGGDRFLSVFGASILAGFALIAGFLLLIIPGIILMILFWSYFHFIADGKTNAADSFSAALEIGKLNVGTTLVLAMVSFLIGLAGVLALLIGSFFAAPLVSMLWCVAYLKMSDQI